MTAIGDTATPRDDTGRKGRYLSPWAIPVAKEQDRSQGDSGSFWGDVGSHRQFRDGSEPCVHCKRSLSLGLASHLHVAGHGKGMLLQRHIMAGTGLISLTGA